MIESPKITTILNNDVIKSKFNTILDERDIGKLIGAINIGSIKEVHKEYEKSLETKTKSVVIEVFKPNDLGQNPTNIEQKYTNEQEYREKFSKVSNPEDMRKEIIGSLPRKGIIEKPFDSSPNVDSEINKELPEFLLNRKESFDEATKNKEEHRKNFSKVLHVI